MNHTTRRLLTWLVATSLIVANVTASAGSGYAANQNYNNNYNYNRGGYSQNPNTTSRSDQASRPAGSSVSASGSTNYRSAARNSRSAYQIAHDYPPSNSPNPNKRAREQQLRALAEKPGLPTKQRNWIMTRYNHIDNRRDEIQKADQRNQAKSAKVRLPTSSLAGKQ